MGLVWACLSPQSVFFSQSCDYTPYCIKTNTVLNQCINVSWKTSIRHIWRMCNYVTLAYPLGHLYLPFKRSSQRSKSTSVLLITSESYNRIQNNYCLYGPGNYSEIIVESNEGREIMGEIVNAACSLQLKMWNWLDFWKIGMYVSNCHFYSRFNCQNILG